MGFLSSRWTRVACTHGSNKPVSIREMAEGERFELSDLLQSPVFKTGAFGRSATPPQHLTVS